MEEGVASTVPDAELIGIQFRMASHHDIRTASISDCPISHASQLANPFLGLPLEMGKCESCGTAEPGKCEGHFGYIELPIPIYHPSHVRELQRLLSLICLKCLKFKTHKVPVNNNGVMEKLLSACCDEACLVSIRERKNNDGASFLELRIPSRSRVQEGCWNFLEKYGYRYGDGCSRPLLPSEVLVMLKKLPEETRRKLAKKGYVPQDGYILRYIPVPPNCLSVPDISDGVSVMSSDLSSAMLKKVLRQIEVIRSSRSGEPNFESHEVEANDLQVSVLQYLQVRGTSKAARAGDNRHGVTKEESNTASKAWVDKMRTLFISKGSGFSSRSVITGDAYRSVNEVGVPSEIAQKMTFEERVNVHNIQYLQSLVDKNQCLTFRDGLSTYSLREGSKGHTFLKLGQIVHRRVMDGDIVFINRPPTTHKHSLQALRVYIHDDHVVKINPLMCSPLSADFDGDCVHLFYPQSLSARAEVLELFSVEKQLLSSHNGNLNLQLAIDALLSLKTLFKVYSLDKASAQQLAMHSSTCFLPSPAIRKACSSGPRWTAEQVLQTALPSDFECHGERLLIRGGEVVKLDYNRDAMASIIGDILNTLFFNRSPKDCLDFFDSIQPLLMENLFSEGFSVGLNDFFYPISDLKAMQMDLQDLSSLLFQLRSSFNELVQLQFEGHIKQLKFPVSSSILKSSALGNMIDSRSDSAVNKIVEQVGFLGLQLSDKKKFYSRGLVEEVSTLFHQKYPFASKFPSEEFGFVTNCFFHGLDPYEEMVHAIATREVIVRSSKGLAEPGTLFKNLMAILRDVVVCYDGTVRNISSNSIIQFEYGVGGGMPSQILFAPGEPVGVLAATAMSNPAYKAVLDSTPNSNSSWDMMKEILFCRTNFRNDLNDRRVILYLNECSCGRKYCQENASCLVKNHLKKVSLRDAAVELSIEYKRPKFEPESCETDTGLVGHIHLNRTLLKESRIGMNDILMKCEEQINLLRKRKKYGYFFKRILLSVSECCFFKPGGKWVDMPCLKFFWQEQDLSDSNLERTKHIMADMICPALLDTIIKGDPRISTVNIIWINPGTTTWVQSPSNNGKGELGVEVTLEKEAVKQNGDAWRIVLDCCLPVFHLIDTTRSIPYAIKQVQDLFGISCAFDQAIQRLSTSVTMVTKDVLKEHLLLLASSMTCSGNLVGFNMGGIKALCRALNVQVPFTEATLYTPRKCFERASEKCHVDTLASIVGSCSWGKRVALGTGAKFDILWDTKEVDMADKPTDVYNFLHLVSSSNDEEMDTGCLGDDIENFDFEDVYKDQALSPEQENKAVFDDMIDVDGDSELLGTGGGGSSWDAMPSAGNSWNAKKSGTDSEEGGGWSTWGSKQNNTKLDDSSTSGGWGAKKESDANKTTEDGGWSSWGSKIDDGVDASKSWGQPKKKENDNNSTWGQQGGNSEEETTGKSTGGWGSGGKNNGEVGSQSWNSQKKENKNQSSWGQQKNDGGDSGSWGTNNENKDGGFGNWGTQKTDKPQSNSWGKQKEDNKPQSSWGQQKDNNEGGGGGGGWSSKKSFGDSYKREDKKESSSWSQQNNDNSTTGGWNVNKGQGDGGSNSWGSQKKEKAQPSWGQSDNNQGTDSWKSGNASEVGDSGGWESGKKDNTTQSSWGQPKSTEGGSLGAWGSQKHDKPKPSWGQSDNGDKGTDSWKSGNVSEGGSSGGWGSQKQDRPKPSWGQSDNNKGTDSWKSGNASEGGSAGGWGSQKQDRPKPSWGQSDNNNKGNDSWKSGNAEGGSSGGWGSEKQDRSKPSWGQSDNNKGNDSWKSGNAEGGSSGGWGSQKQDKPKPSWGQSDNNNKGNDSWKSGNASEGGSSGGWGSQKQDKPKPSWGKSDNNNKGNDSWKSGNDSKAQSSWGKSDISKQGTDSGKSDNASEGGWGSVKKENKMQSSWGQPKSTEGSAGGWSSDKPSDGDRSNTWGSQKKDKPKPSWGKSDISEKGIDSWKSDSASDGGNSGGWGKSDNSNKGGTDSWQSADASDGGGSGGWGSIKKEKKTESAWGQPKSAEESEGDGSNGWKSKKGEGSESQWGQPGGSNWGKKRTEGGGGWGSTNSGEWKSRNNNRPPRPGGPKEDAYNGPLTATKRRMDIFTSEEQDVLSAVESVMLSIRRIMHPPGFNDGDPLPADDQTWVIENVLNYHPDKASKIGAGVDFITVKKHSKFQDSRCFFVVSTDGQDTDFSYVKCLKHFVMEKYPSLAESFSRKYFRQQRSEQRGEGNPSPQSPTPPSPAPPSPAPSSPAPQS